MILTLHRPTPTEPEKAIEDLKSLLAELDSVGLTKEVRAGYDQTLLIFVKAPRELLGNFVYKSR